MSQTYLELDTQPPKKSGLPTTSREALDQAFASLTPLPQQEAHIRLARRIMGREVDDLADPELAQSLTGLQYLIDQWCEEFERNVFEGRTIKEAYTGV